METMAKKEKKTRSEMEYFDSLFRNLGPFRYQEVDWARQKYASYNSAINSIRAAIKKRNLNTINVRGANNKIFLYSSEFESILPCDKPTLETAFKKADIYLSKHPEAVMWPIPEWLVPKTPDLTNFQIGMQIRDELKAKYPYLTVKLSGKNGYDITRDKSYGNLCAEPSDTAETEPVDEKIDEVAADPVMISPTTDSVEPITIPTLPFHTASGVAVFLSSQGYDVSMKIHHSSTNECFATVSFVKG